MPATNYQGKESEQSKARRGKNPKPKPWYMGFGLARFAADKLKKSREERDRKMAKIKKE